MTASIRFSSVTIACPNPEELGAFYADLTDGEVTFTHQNEWASLRCPGGRIEFMGVPNYDPPRWPEDTSLIHIDFHVDDLEVASTRAESAGATRFATQPNASHCLVFADPAGHPFCLSLLEEVG